MKWAQQIILVWLLMLSLNLSGQVSKNKIDSIIFKEIVELDQQENYNKAYELGKYTEAESKKQNYLKGEAWSCFRIANTLINSEKFGESLK